MKKIVAVVLIVSIALFVTACGAPASKNETKSNETTQKPTTNTTVEEIQDDGWDKLASLGKVSTEDGILTTSITLPADFVGEEMTQEQLDSNKNENYISAKLNADGSVTYKMTKKQHKAMLDETTKGIEESLKEMIEDEDFAFTKIEHNKDYTKFDATISTEDLGFAESFAVVGLYMYGGIYGAFSGEEPDNVEVNIYNAAGKLIHTANSKDMGTEN